VAVGTREAVGVQVGGKISRGVGVAVGKDARDGSVGGGKGLNPMYGLMKIMRKTVPTHKAARTTTTVNRLSTSANVSLGGRTISS
jgi:hypothetical protein